MSNWQIEPHRKNPVERGEIFHIILSSSIEVGPLGIFFLTVFRHCKGTAVTLFYNMYFTDLEAIYTAHQYQAAFFYLKIYTNNVLPMLLFANCCAAKFPFIGGRMMLSSPDTPMVTVLVRNLLYIVIKQKIEDLLVFIRKSMQLVNYSFVLSSLILFSYYL